MSHFSASQTSILCMYFSKWITYYEIVYLLLYCELPVREQTTSGVDLFLLFIFPRSNDIWKIGCTE